MGFLLAINARAVMGQLRFAASEKSGWASQGVIAPQGGSTFCRCHQPRFLYEMMDPLGKGPGCTTVNRVPGSRKLLSHLPRWEHTCWRRLWGPGLNAAVRWEGGSPRDQTHSHSARSLQSQPAEDLRRSPGGIHDAQIPLGSKAAGVQEGILPSPLFSSGQ